MQFVFGLVFFARALVSVLALIVWCTVGPLLFLVLRAFSYSGIEKIPMLFHRGACRIIGIHVECEGHISEASPALFVANHISYLDIFAVGASLRGHFIAKSEIANWPVMGKLARFQNTLFVARDPRKAAMQIGQMRQYLDQGGRLILFPEGTSTLGTDVRPFKSSLFKAAEVPNAREALSSSIGVGVKHDIDDSATTHKPVVMQPFAVAYTHVAGRPIDSVQRGRFAWHDDTPLALHFMRILGARTVTVKLLFAKPVFIEDFESRKACARYCRDEVATLLASTL